MEQSHRPQEPVQRAPNTIFTQERREHPTATSIDQNLKRSRASGFASVFERRQGLL